MVNTIDIRSSQRIELIDITGRVSEIVSASKMHNGIACLFVPHTTAAITINEAADPSVVKDIIKKTSSLVPRQEGYLHMEGNSDSHIKTSLFGPQLNIIIEGGNLVLGTWQGVYFAEFDGPRARKIYIKLIQD